MKKNCQIVGRQDLIRVQPRRQSYKFFRWGFLFQCFPIKHGVETSWAHILFISFSWFEILNQKKDHVLFLNSFIFPQNSKFSVKLLLRLSQNVNKLIKSAYSAQLAGDDKAARWSGLSNVQGRRNLRVKEVIPQILIDKLTLKFNPNREGGGGRLLLVSSGFLDLLTALRRAAFAECLGGLISAIWRRLVGSCSR